ncbi:MAG: hypothetical protein LBF38_09370 [Deltaproteobacteria bacterium]|jgi:hypothetical protein|nr:hypothetical protein [Deltaproteobacteria bacterium]
MDLPEEEKDQVLAQVDNCQDKLADDYENNVEKGVEEMENEMGELTDEAESYAQAADKNVDALKGLQAQSDFGSDALNQASEDQ